MVEGENSGPATRFGFGKSDSESTAAVSESNRVAEALKPIRRKVNKRVVIHLFNDFNCEGDTKVMRSEDEHFCSNCLSLCGIDFPDGKEANTATKSFRISG